MITFSICNSSANNIRGNKVALKHHLVCIFWSQTSNDGLTSLTGKRAQQQGVTGRRPNQSSPTQRSNEAVQEADSSDSANPSGFHATPDIVGSFLSTTCFVTCF